MAILLFCASLAPASRWLSDRFIAAVFGAIAYYVGCWGLSLGSEHAGGITLLIAFAAGVVSLLSLLLFLSSMFRAD